MGRSEEALVRFERRTAWPMLILALAMIPLLVVPLVAELSPSAERVMVALDWVIWAAFVAEYGVRLYLAPRRGHFVRSNVIDLIVVLVPFLRPLRVASSARLLRLLGLGRVIVFGLRALKATKRVLLRHKLAHVALVAEVIVVVIAAIVVELEDHIGGATITTFPTALWWAISTVTTVGYGDTYPVSVAGRVLAVILMVIGIGLFGVFAAALASYFVERDQEAEREEETSDLKEVIERLDRIEKHLKIGSEEGDSDEPPRSALEPFRGGMEGA